MIAEQKRQGIPSTTLYSKHPLPSSLFKASLAQLSIQSFPYTFTPALTSYIFYPDLTPYTFYPALIPYIFYPDPNPHTFYPALTTYTFFPALTPYTFYLL